MRSSTSPIVRWVFDLDGVLIDSESLVREAYRRVGVEMPEDAWGKPAREWMPQRYGRGWTRLHDAKNAAYERLFHMAVPEPTTAVEAVRRLNVAGESCYLLTGASARATIAVVSHALPDLRWTDLYTGMTSTMKVTQVDKLTSRRGLVVYVDDDQATCDLIELSVPRVRVVRYDIRTTRTEDIFDGCGDLSRG